MGTLSKLPSRLERGEHLYGDAHCLQCGHKWMAVAPVGSIEIECPTLKGLLTAGCEPEVAWTCACGCYVFMLSVLGDMICWDCGTTQTLPE